MKSILSVITVCLTFTACVSLAQPLVSSGGQYPRVKMRKTKRACQAKGLGNVNFAHGNGTHWHHWGYHGGSGGHGQGQSQGSGGSDQSTTVSFTSQDFSSTSQEFGTVTTELLAASISSSTSHIVSSATDLVTTSQIINVETSRSTSTTTLTSTITLTQGRSKSQPAPSSTKSSDLQSSQPTESTGNAALPGKASDQDPKGMIKMHNDLRAKHDADPLTWDDGLAQTATNWALQCKPGHSGSGYGENVAAGAGGGYNLQSAFTSWANEEPSLGGHYTQIVWKSTKRIGCAAVTCPDGTLFTGFDPSLQVVCEYDPPGNSPDRNANVS